MNRRKRGRSHITKQVLHIIIASQLREKKLFLKHITTSLLNFSLLFLSRPLSMHGEKKEHKQMEELEKERVFFIYKRREGVV